MSRTFKIDHKKDYYLDLQKIITNSQIKHISDSK